MLTWVDRYRAGQRSRVWTEMLQVGAAVRDESEYLEQAHEVIEETIARSIRNIDRLISGLPNLGYEFAPSEGCPVRRGPDDADAACLDAIEFVAGPLPLFLRQWLLRVGEVNFVGCNPAWTPDWTHSRNDPLVVQCPPGYMLSEFEAWELDRGTIHESGPFRVPVAPDELHKAHVSGGAPYELEVPNSSVDGLLLGQRGHTTLVNHLRICFAGGGFADWPDGPPEELLPLIGTLEKI